MHYVWLDRATVRHSALFLAELGRGSLRKRAPRQNAKPKHRGKTANPSTAAKRGQSAAVRESTAAKRAGRRGHRPRPTGRRGGSGRRHDARARRVRLAPPSPRLRRTAAAVATGDGKRPSLKRGGFAPRRTFASGAAVSPNRVSRRLGTTAHLAFIDTLGGWRYTPALPTELKWPLFETKTGIAKTGTVAQGGQAQNQANKH